MSKHGAHSVARKNRTRSTARRDAGAAPIARGCLAERVALSLFGAALVAFIAYCVFAPPSEHMQEMAVQNLQEVLSEVDHANAHVAAMSELIAGGLDEAAVKRAEQVLDGEGDVDDELERASRQLNAVSSYLPEEYAAAADALGRGIEGRRDMLSYGSVVLDASVRAYGLAPQVEELWQTLLGGHDALAASAAQIEIGTTPAVKKALASDEEAQEAYQRALELMDGIEEQTPGYAFTAERFYAEKQVQAAGEAIAADKALLDGDTAAAQQHMASYQQAAAEAAAIAESLPATADDLLKSIYYSLGTDDLSIADAEKGYAEAAQRTARIDGELADYRTSEGLQS